MPRNLLPTTPATVPHLAATRQTISLTKEATEDHHHSTKDRDNIKIHTTEGNITNNTEEEATPSRHLVTTSINLHRHPWDLIQAIRITITKIVMVVVVGMLSRSQVGLVAVLGLGVDGR